MRRKSLKRAAIDRAALPIRDAIREEAGRCDKCGRHNRGLDVHEILRGKFRVRTQSEPCNLLVLCRECHDTMGGKSWEYQLALLLLNRDHRYDLNRFHELAYEARPDQCDVDREADLILNPRRT